MNDNLDEDPKVLHDSHTDRHTDDTHTHTETDEGESISFLAMVDRSKLLVCDYVSNLLVY